ncbi:MAG TPA: DUF5666 domain-containing protein [candidate division Zixibacteria bacterium]|nr:DUF5666 domain-containing protein [candidate division Zixibacteria bacterium]
MYRTCAVLLLVLSFAAIAAAHGKEQHVVGFVTKIAGTEITVKTLDKGEVTVTATATTEFYEGNTKVSLKELKVGERVVIHAIKKESKLEAHTVRFAAPAGGAS